MTHIEQDLRLRPGVLGDAKEVGKIIFDAFSVIADKHGFPREVPTVDVGIDIASYFLSNLGFYSVVAEDTVGSNNKVIGSNC